MRTALRLTLVPVLLFVVLVACGDDKDSKSSSTTTVVTQSPTTATTVRTSGAVTSTTSALARNVVDGAVCTPQGGRGTTSQGVAELCTLVGGDLRWRPA